jgi:hypothetical protein
MCKCIWKKSKHNLNDNDNEVTPTSSFTRSDPSFLHVILHFLIVLFVCYRYFTLIFFIWPLWKICGRIKRLQPLWLLMTSWWLPQTLTSIQTLTRTRQYVSFFIFFLSFCTHQFRVFSFKSCHSAKLNWNVCSIFWKIKECGHLPNVQTNSLRGTLTLNSLLLHSLPWLQLSEYFLVEWYNNKW